MTGRAAATGSGKTLAFLIPIIEMLQSQPTRQTSALILLPTRELAMQVHEQYEKLRSKNTHKAALVIGGVSEKAQISGLRAGAGLVIARGAVTCHGDWGNSHFISGKGVNLTQKKQPGLRITENAQTPLGIVSWDVPSNAKNKGGK